jgi:hypothetical protein
MDFKQHGRYGTDGEHLFRAGPKPHALWVTLTITMLLRLLNNPQLSFMYETDAEVQAGAEPGYGLASSFTGWTPAS